MAIAVAVEYVSSYEGEKGETVRLASLPLEAIFIPTYQRDRKPHHRKIAGEFDRSAYVFPVVLEYDGRYAAVDGQQRLAACGLRGDETVVVLLIEGVKNEKRAADLYLKFNRDRRGLSAFEKFTGAHAAGDPGTLEITRILKSCGLRAAKSAASSDCIPAGTAAFIHATHGGDTLLRVLEVRELAWGDANERQSRESKTLRGLAAFLRSYWNKVDDAVLVDVLRKMHPASMLSKIDGNIEGTFDNRYSNYVRFLYNKKFPAGSKKRL